MRHFFEIYKLDQIKTLEDIKSLSTIYSNQELETILAAVFDYKTIQIDEEK